MSIDLDRERPISFNEAAKYLPANARPHTSTWWRWWKVGVKGVRLETVVCGGRRYTTAASVQRFFRRLTDADDSCARDSRSSSQAFREAERELEAEGIKSDSAEPRPSLSPEGT
jgi:hypothetical protein